MNTVYDYVFAITFINYKHVKHKILPQICPCISEPHQSNINLKILQRQIAKTVSYIFHEVVEGWFQKPMEHTLSNIRTIVIVVREIDNIWPPSHARTTMGNSGENPGLWARPWNLLIDCFFTVNYVALLYRVERKEAKVRCLSIRRDRDVELRSSTDTQDNEMIHTGRTPLHQWFPLL